MVRMRRAAAVFSLTLIAAAATWLVGFATALELTPWAVAPPAGVQVPANFGLYHEAWAIVRGEFYGAPAPSDEVTFGAVRGLLDSLDDPYADFATRMEAREGAEAIPEVIGSLGIWVEPLASGARIVATLPDSPGRRAGLQPGDTLVGVGDETLESFDRDELIALLQGPPGSSVVATVLRPEGRLFTVELVRDELPLPLTEVRVLGGNVGYLRITHFDRGLESEVDTALDDLAAGGTESLVLDLRDNPGGRIATLRSVASRFVDGPLWIERTRHGESTVLSEGEEHAHVPSRVVVLINEGTASAAEVLAALLSERLGAPLVGATTFGKSAVQGVVTLSDGSALRLTMGEWTTPDGTGVSEGGLAPDRPVASAEGQLEAAMELASRQAAAGG